MSLNKRFAGIQEITRLLYNVNFAGTNTKEEFCELQNNMIKMLATNKYSYSDIENYFLSWGYQTQLIQQVYKYLTGLEPERVNSVDYLFNIPGCLPGFNYGWGEGKGKYKYVFIINYKLGFGVFGQIDDLNRELIDYVLDLDEALSILNSKGKNIRTCKEIIAVPGKVLDTNSRVPHLSSDYPVAQGTIFKGRTASLAKEISEHDLQSHEVRAMLRTAYDKKEITAQEHKDLYQFYLSRFAENEEGNTEEEVKGQTKDLEKEPVEKTDINTNKNGIEFEFTNIKNGITKIEEYLMENLRDIYEQGNIHVQGMALEVKSKNNAIEKTPEVPGQNTVQYFDNAAQYKVALGVTLNEFSEVGEQTIKTIFSIDNKGRVIFNGQFKGANEELYPLNLSGIQNYLTAASEVDKPVKEEK